jgi:CheY-like chemotaxis protein
MLIFRDTFDWKLRCFNFTTFLHFNLTGSKQDIAVYSKDMGTKKTIYLVDDDQDDRAFIRQALVHVQPGVEVVEATSGFELLALLQLEAHPLASLILMDMNMPKMSGLETLLRLKSDCLLPEIPVVMISTTANPLYIRKAYEAGVAGFINKPYTLKGFEELASQITTSHFLHNRGI